SEGVILYRSTNCSLVVMGCFAVIAFSTTQTLPCVSDGLFGRNRKKTDLEWASLFLFFGLMHNAAFLTVQNPRKHSGRQFFGLKIIFHDFFQITISSEDCQPQELCSHLLIVEFLTVLSNDAC